MASSTTGDERDLRLCGVGSEVDDLVLCIQCICGVRLGGGLQSRLDQMRGIVDEVFCCEGMFSFLKREGIIKVVLASYMTLFRLTFLVRSCYVYSFCEIACPMAGSIAREVGSKMDGDSGLDTNAHLTYLGII